MPAQNAFAYPGPGGPAITSVLERHYANAIEQQILLATSAHTSGQNMLRVQLFGPVDRAASGQTPLREGYLPPGNTNSEMRQLFPGVRMTRSPYYVQNRYGPFGYAAGRSASGDTCFYGWQRLTSTGSTQTWIGNKGSIQIRLRLCDQSLSEQRLLQAMYDFTISTYFRTGNWNPYGEANAPDASLGKSGSPVYPLGATEFATVTTPLADRPPPAGRRKRVERATDTPPAPRQPEPVGPTVPPPPVTGTPAVKAAQPAGERSTVRDMPASTVTVPPPPCGPDGAKCQ